MRSILLLVLAGCSSAPALHAGCRVEDHVYPCETSFYVERGVIHQCVETCPVGDQCALGLDGRLLVGFCDGTYAPGFPVSNE